MRKLLICGVFLLPYRQRQHSQLYDKGKHQDSHADAGARVLADDLIDRPHDIAEWVAYDTVQELYCVHVLSFGAALWKDRYARCCVRPTG